MGRVRGARKTDNKPNTEKMRRRYTSERVQINRCEKCKTLISQWLGKNIKSYFRIWKMNEPGTILESVDEKFFPSEGELLNVRFRLTVHTWRWRVQVVGYVVLELLTPRPRASTASIPNAPLLPTAFDVFMPTLVQECTRCNPWGARPSIRSAHVASYSLRVVRPVCVHPTTRVPYAGIRLSTTIWKSTCWTRRNPSDVDRSSDGAESSVCERHADVPVRTMCTVAPVWFDIVVWIRALHFWGLNKKRLARIRRIQKHRAVLKKKKVNTIRCDTVDSVTCSNEKCKYVQKYVDTPWKPGF